MFDTGFSFRIRSSVSSGRGNRNNSHLLVNDGRLIKIQMFGSQYNESCKKKKKFFFLLKIVITWLFLSFKCLVKSNVWETEYRRWTVKQLEHFYELWWRLFYSLLNEEPWLQRNILRIIASPSVGESKFQWSGGSICESVDGMNIFVFIIDVKLTQDSNY